MPEQLLEWGILFTLSVQNWGDWLIGPMQWLSLTGNIEFYLLLLPALYWLVDRRLGLRLGVALMLSISLNSLLKMGLHDPRPYWMEAQVRLLGRPESSFGVPSGHAQNAMVTWGILAAYLNRAWAWLVAGLLMGLVGLSRVYLGVHFPTDVLAGWLLGGLLLLLVFRLEAPTRRWLQSQGAGRRVALLFGFALGVILLGALVSQQSSAAWPVPSAWRENAARWSSASLAPFSLEDIIVSMAALFGFGCGAILLPPQRRIDRGGPWAKRLGRYLLGLVVLFLLWRGLGLLFAPLAPEESLLGYSLRFGRYALIGAWVSAGGPLLFQRWGLAEPVDLVNE